MCWVRRVLARSPWPPVSHAVPITCAARLAATPAPASGPAAFHTCCCTYTDATCHLPRRERQAERIKQQLEQERQVLGKAAGPAPITRELMGSGSDWRVGARAAAVQGDALTRSTPAFGCKPNAHQALHSVVSCKGILAAYQQGIKGHTTSQLTACMAARITYAVTAISTCLAVQARPHTYALHCHHNCHTPQCSS